MGSEKVNELCENRESLKLQSQASPHGIKTKKLDDSSSSDSHVVVLAVPSPSIASSAASSSQASDEKSSSISSDCFSTESNETVRNNPTSGVDLEDTVSEALGETTETESSSALKRDNKPPEASKIPTAEEIEAFLSELEGGDDKQKRFIEKRMSAQDKEMMMIRRVEEDPQHFLTRRYNFDIVNDKPLQRSLHVGST
ncbi:hypothetical protein Bca52824_066012 [Brassica carinata]|uniref:Cyclin-dependent kinase inhibitor n=1 Tax=Brassica carinata TaxID=52824 RepID=A0A8X7UA71_BRACI|nr:hypothetical protein Bca52824_066012 [Brassica carinata]